MEKNALDTDFIPFERIYFGCVINDMYWCSEKLNSWNMENSKLKSLH